MFNSLCYYLNFASPIIPAALRRLVFIAAGPFKREWTYGRSVCGYRGGVDVPLFGTLAFRDDADRLTFVW